MTGPETTRREDCVSELELDRLLAGDDEPALRRRVEACEHCRQRLAALEAARAAWMTPDHVARQAASIVTRLAAAAPPVTPPWWQRWFVGAPLALVAVAGVLALFWSRRPGVGEGPPVDQVRIKGSLRLDVVLADPAPRRLLSDGDAVPPGATLSFRAACATGCSVALFARSAAGLEPITDRVPPPWRVAGTADLPVSVTVDAEPGDGPDDVIVAVFCAEPRDLAALRTELETAYPESRPTPAAIAGCEVRAHRVRRGGSPP